MYLLPASAGFGNFMDSDSPSESILVYTDRVPAGTNVIVKVSGDSMMPAYRDGDMVYVQRSESVLEGEVGIFNLNGDEYIKMLGHNCLISFNQDYDPIELQDSDTLVCQGKVLGRV
jgi:repressor LexA